MGSFVASREQLRRRPREAFARADALTASGDGRCHRGPLNWTSLYAKMEHHAHTVTEDAPRLTKHTQAAAVERLQRAKGATMRLRRLGTPADNTLRQTAHETH